MSERKGLQAGGLRLHACGLTIIEFVVSLAIAAIALGVAIPALQQFSVNNQVISANNTIVAGLNMARSTSITTGEDITICPTQDGSSCSEDNWDSGWIIFTDEDSDGSVDDGEMIRVVSIESNLENTGFGDNIVFQSDGTTTLSSTATITNCHESSSHSDACTEVSISRFGMIQSESLKSGGDEGEGSS